MPLLPCHCCHATSRCSEERANLREDLASRGAILLHEAWQTIGSNNCLLQEVTVLCYRKECKRHSSSYILNSRDNVSDVFSRCDCVCVRVQVAVEDIIADGRLRLAVTPVFDESQLAAALQVFCQLYMYHLLQSAWHICPAVLLGTLCTCTALHQHLI